MRVFQRKEVLKMNFQILELRRHFRELLGLISLEELFINQVLRRRIELLNELFLESEAI